MAKSTNAVNAAQALSFLKETFSNPEWADRDFAKALNLGVKEAREALALLDMQGYVASAGAHKWRTTASGLAISAAKKPRFTLAAIETALSDLQDRIKAVNNDDHAPFRISKAVAYGDFLRKGTRSQAAEVGVELARRKPAPNESGTAREMIAESAFLKQLRGSTAALHLRLYEPWMSGRTHRILV